MALDMDYFSRKMRRPKIETQEEVTQRMQAVELAVKEALAARGETHFTDQEFPPTEQSLYVDPDHPPAKLQVCPQIIGGCSCFIEAYYVKGVRNYIRVCPALENLFSSIDTGG